MRKSSVVRGICEPYFFVNSRMGFTSANTFMNLGFHECDCNTEGSNLDDKF